MIAINGDKPLQEDISYWSSTSMCSLKSWNNLDHENSKNYTLAESPNNDHNTKFRFTKSDFNLSEDELYSLSMNVCAGENMLTQKFSDGLVESKARNQAAAALRPVRRIPLIVVNCPETYSILKALTAYNLNTCPACPDGC